MREIEKKLRKDALLLAHRCQDGNLQSVFSCMDILWVLYDRVMRWSVETAQADDRDFFIISKGQATLALYPVLCEKGMFRMEEIVDEIGHFDSRYCIQTDLTKFQGGIENNAGSLGHGFPFAAGIAYANKVKRSPSHVYVLAGDGEFCEGTMWETCIFAGTKRLDNLCVIIDDNRSAGAMVELDDLRSKLEAFHFEVFSVDGHDPAALEAVFHQTDRSNGKPKAVIARTVRGWGSRTMMEQDIWFHKAPDENELVMLLQEVDTF